MPLSCGMLVDAFEPDATSQNDATWEHRSRRPNGIVIARARRGGVRCSAIDPMAGQSSAQRSNQSWGRTLAAGQAPWVHAMRWIHCDQAVAMPGTEGPPSRGPGRACRSKRSEPRCGASDSASQGRQARQRLTPCEAESDAPRGVKRSVAWGARVAGVAVSDAPRGRRSRGGRGAGDPAGAGRARVDWPRLAAADCAVGSGEWAEPPHPPWALHRRGGPEGTFWPPAGGPPPDPPEDQSPQGGMGGPSPLLDPLRANRDSRRHSPIRPARGAASPNEEERPRQRRGGDDDVWRRAPEGRHTPWQGRDLPPHDDREAARPSREDCRPIAALIAAGRGGSPQARPLPHWQCTPMPHPCRL